jgi:hypothetical protein
MERRRSVLPDERETDEVEVKRSLVNRHRRHKFRHRLARRQIVIDPDGAEHGREIAKASVAIFLSLIFEFDEYGLDH